MNTPKIVNSSKLNNDVNNLWLNIENDLIKHLMDERDLNENQYYMVVSYSGNKFFPTKIKLESYLKSLDPLYEFNKLSELVINLIGKNLIVDSTITKLT